MFTETISHQLYSAFLFSGWGFLFGLYADLFTVWRLTFHSRRLSAILQDIALLLSGAVAFFLLALPLSGGRLRWYLFVGAGVGFLAWQKTLGRIVVPALTRLASKIRRAVAVFRRWIDRRTEKVRGFVKKGGDFLKKHLHSLVCALYNKLDICVYLKDARRKEGDHLGEQTHLPSTSQEKKHIFAHRPRGIRRLHHRHAHPTANGDQREGEGSRRSATAPIPALRRKR
ncbi:MAG: spore cortex biosynthesis protein YabQ [Clostridia bacterium]|nr:spore cortex biosynthesis protein YabQ [Clostridia bacterium]